MQGGSTRFRDRARECRAIARGVSNWADASILEEIAEEFETLAARVATRAKPKLTLIPGREG